MMNAQKRIVSLLPSTTEIVAGLGLQNLLVGRSHECDFPPDVRLLPACTEPKFNPDGQSYKIDQRLKAFLQEGLSVYRVDAKKLSDLRPDIIITQDHCEVCAASEEQIIKATREYLHTPVDIISVSPTDLAGVYGSIRQIARPLDSADAGEEFVRSMQDVFRSIKQQTQVLDSKRLLCMEWLDPLMSAGNWVPELTQIAGGTVLAAQKGTHSPWIDWENVIALNPDVICIIPCGYSIDETMSEMDFLTKRDNWSTIKAVRDQQVFIADGHHFFNRPGPRLTESARILAEILHPSVVESSFKQTGWVNFFEYSNKIIAK